MVEVGSARGLLDVGAAAGAGVDEISLLEALQRRLATVQAPRLGGWAAGPFLAGLLLQGAPLAAPFLAGAGLKIAYDLLLYAAFRGAHPPEERGQGS